MRRPKPTSTRPPASSPPSMQALPSAAARPLFSPTTSSSNGFPTEVPRFLYAPSRHLELPPATSASPTARLADIIIPAHHFTSANPSLSATAARVWGGTRGVYTDDSDIVAVLAHAAWLIPPDAPPHNLRHVRVRVRLCAEGEVSGFHGVEGGAVESGSWPADSYQGGGMRVEEVEEVFAGEEVRSVRRRKRARVLGCVHGFDAFGAKRKVARGEKVIVFDLAFDPCEKYECAKVDGAASGVRARLEDEVMYVENDRERFEVAWVGKRVRFARVRAEVVERASVEGIFGERASVPLGVGEVEVLHEVEWTKYYWDAEGVTVEGKHYRLTKMLFRKRDDVGEGEEGG